MNGVTIPVILDHKTACELGLGSNHGDVQHWFSKHGKTLDDVRKDVAALMGVKENKVDTTIDGNYVKGAKVKLSANFNSSEFDCKGKGCCSETLVDQQLVEYLQKIRTHFGKAVNISSGYRCATHNKNVGGATGSRHAKGQAADIYINGVAPAEIAKYAESIGIKGIGLYETDKDGHFVHIDTRTTKAFWYGQAQASRTTFGGSTTTETPKVEASKLPYLVKVTASVLNYRSGPGTSHKIKGTIKKGEVYTIVEENGTWGKLKSGAGWIHLGYTKKI